MRKPQSVWQLLGVQVSDYIERETELMMEEAHQLSRDELEWHVQPPQEAQPMMKPWSRHSTSISHFYTYHHKAMKRPPKIRNFAVHHGKH